jgi:hypothetical protein
MINMYLKTIFNFDGKRLFLRRMSLFMLMFWLILSLQACWSGQSRDDINKQIETRKISWVWQDSFSSAQQSMLKEWIGQIYLLTDELLGPFPFEVEVHFHRREGASEPVPWAHTRRSGNQELHFHVDPNFSPEAFWTDWTAPHEISHLALPFLGKKHAWFAEGFASYMQNLVQLEMGVMTREEVNQKLEEKITYNSAFFDGKKEPFQFVATELVRATHNFPAMYWGGASYFIRLDNHLQTKGKSLPGLIRDYQEPCRMKDKNLSEVISSLDSILGEPICAELLEMYTEKPAAQLFEGLKF